jgi:chemotaxis protein MotB
MPISLRLPLFTIVGLILFGQTACNMVPYQALRQSQLRSLQLHHEKEAFSQQNQGLSQELAKSNSQLRTANERIDNLNSERSTLRERMLGLIRNKSGNPLGKRSTGRLNALSKKYKNFEFDPETGISKFHSDVLFPSGSDAIKPSAVGLMREFAEIMNEADAKKLNVLVVGHTDDKRIANAATRRRHPTNWHLSTNRANTVVLALRKFGVKESRLGSAGYSMFQPVVPNKDERSRQMNRRVEIYVLAPDAVIAGRWESTFQRH